MKRLSPSVLALLTSSMPFRRGRADHASGTHAHRVRHHLGEQSRWPRADCFRSACGTHRPSGLEPRVSEQWGATSRHCMPTRLFRLRTSWLAVAWAGVVASARLLRDEPGVRERSRPQLLPTPSLTRRWVTVILRYRGSVASQGTAPESQWVMRSS